jgi:hypothetical protein
MSVAATDSLSFDELYLALPEGLSVIVGPNGSGKRILGARRSTGARRPVNHQVGLDAGGVACPVQCRTPRDAS